MADIKPGSFAAKLRHLIETVHPSDREPYSYREIAAGIKDKSGQDISAAYLNHLANSVRDNPKIGYVEAIAEFFGVPPAYFLDDVVTARINQQISDLVTWKSTEAREMAERIMRLGPRERNAVNGLIESMQNYEGQNRQKRSRRKPEPGTK